MGSPKHCCPFWDCEYIDVYCNDETATYQCGVDPPQAQAFAKRLIRTIADPDYHRWEYRSEEEIHFGTGITFEVTVECDRRQERRQEGYGPCAELSAYFNGNLALPGVEWCFGPLIMDDRQCQCLRDEPPGEDHVGFNWGTATLSDTALAEDQEETDCTCVFAIGSGDLITASCTCAGCECYGFPESLEAEFDCTFLGAAFVIPLSYIDASTLPPPNENYTPLPSKVWFGSYDLGGGCSLELLVECEFGQANAGPIMAGLYLVIGPGCVRTPEELSTNCGLAGPGFAGNPIILSYQCHDGATPFELVYGFCSVVGDPTCAGGTILSTLTIREV